MDGFDDVREVTTDGFGPVLEARRAGRAWAIRVFTGVSRIGVPDAMVARLARPAHPAILPAELGATRDGVYLAAPLEGRLLSAVAAERSGAAVPLAQCAEIGLTLVDAARVAAAAGGRLGPLTWNNIYLDPERPGHCWVFPLWIARTRSADWLRHAARDLLFVDRDTLRQVESPCADRFAIAGVLIALAGELPVTEGDAADLVRRAALEGHPLLEARLTDSGVTGIARRALGAGELLDVAGLGRALAELRDSTDPVAKAQALRRAGKGLDAMQVLHKAVQQDGAPLGLLILKARIELEHNQRERTIRTLRAVRETYPMALEAVVLLAQLVGDPGEQSELYAQAIALDPLDLELRFARALALERQRKLDDALRALEALAQIASADPSADRIAARTAVRIGRLLIEKRAHPVAACACVEPYLHDDDGGLRAEALAVVGAAHAEQGRFAEAEQLLRDALALDRAARPDAPCTFVLNHLAYALVATGKRREARDHALRSFESEPGQDHLLRLLAALGR
jgi:tetratricopeptide (TPR) repeat protein